MKLAKVNNTLYTYLEILSFYLYMQPKLFQMFYFNEFEEANIHLYTGPWKYGRKMTMVGLAYDKKLKLLQKMC